MKKTLIILTALALLLDSCKSKTTTPGDTDSDPNAKPLSDVVLNVNVSNAISNTTRNPIGINFNYLRDDNNNRP